MSNNEKTQNSESESNITTRFLYFFAALFSFAGLVILIVFFFRLNSEYTINGDSPIKLDKTAQVGDFIGGLVGALWSFAGVILFFLALLLQRKELVLQRKELKETKKEFRIQNLTLRLQRFENTFFNLLELHHGIVNSIDDDKYEENLGMREYTRHKRSSADLDKVTLHGRDVFKHHFEQLERYLSSINEDTFDKYYLEYWDRVQTDFGHYFRNLYRIIKLVNETEFHSKEDLELKNIDISLLIAKNNETRYRYTSIVRAQLSDYELLWLYYNCLSSNGIDRFKPLVEKYSLLKNIPRNKIAGNELEKLYDDQAFERE